MAMALAQGLRRRRVLRWAACSSEAAIASGSLQVNTPGSSSRTGGRCATRADQRRCSEAEAVGAAMAPA